MFFPDAVVVGSRKATAATIATDPGCRPYRMFANKPSNRMEDSLDQQTEITAGLPGCKRINSQVGLDLFFALRRALQI